MQQNFSTNFIRKIGNIPKPRTRVEYANLREAEKKLLLLVALPLRGRRVGPANQKNNTFLERERKKSGH